MKFATTVVLIVSVMFLGLFILAVTQSTNAIAGSNLPPTGRTGAPGDAGTCISCHSGNGGVSMGTGFFLIPTTGISEYVPGQTDTISVIFNPAAARWGFEATVLKDSDDTMAGTFGPFPDPSVSILTSLRQAGGRWYASHTSNGASAPFTPNDGTWWGFPGGGWAFEWTAPPSGSGPVTFYLTGVDANGDQDATAADTTYTWTLTLQEAGTTAVEPVTWGQIKKRYR